MGWTTANTGGRKWLGSLPGSSPPGSRVLLVDGPAPEPRGILSALFGPPGSAEN